MAEVSGINVHYRVEDIAPSNPYIAPEVPKFSQGPRHRCIATGPVALFLPDDADAARLWLENLSAAVIDALKSYGE
jgi:hypothetical protein